MKRFHTWLPNFHFEFDDGAAYAQATGGDAPPAPGTGEVDPGNGAGPTPTGDTTVQPAQDHGPVPYSRFKDVNDRRRSLEEAIQPYAALESQGYDAAEVQRLVAWEQEYSQDPAGTWLRHAQSIDSLPDAVKAAIASVGEQAPKDPPADGSPPRSEEDQEGEAEDPRVAVLYSDFERRQAAAEQQAHRELVDAMTNAWTEVDKKLEMSTPPEMVLTYIQAAASQEGTPQEIFVRAHQAYMKDRERILESSVTRPGAGNTVPRTVPGGGGAPPTAPPVKPRTLRDATKAAVAAEEAGHLHLSQT